MRYLSVERVIRIHARVIAASGGDAAIRNPASENVLRLLR